MIIDSLLQIYDDPCGIPCVALRIRRSRFLLELHCLMKRTMRACGISIGFCIGWNQRQIGAVSEELEGEDNQRPFILL
jgi:hypothetical protein